MLLRSLCISRLTRVLPLAVVAAALCLFAAAPAVAQFGGGGGGGGFGGGGGGGGLGGGGGGLGGGGGGTQGTGPFSGVAVDADGVVRRVTGVDPTGRLAAMRAEQAFASLDREVARPSKLRKISLTRLVRLTNEAIAAGNAPDDVISDRPGSSAKPISP